MSPSRRSYNGGYENEFLNRVAFPLGGIGAGMVCLEGTGTISHVSVRNQPDVYHEPTMFAALSIQRPGGERVARVLEGPLPAWKFAIPGNARGGEHRAWGLPRCKEASFHARFPFAEVKLSDPALPLAITLTGWSPFIPGNADDSSLPAGVLEYTFHNPSSTPVDAIFSYHARNFMAEPVAWQTPKEQRPVTGVNRIDRNSGGGIVLYQHALADRPAGEGAFAISTDADGASINPCWFRGGWFDALTNAWKTVVEGKTPDTQPHTEGEASSGGSLYVPVALKPGESRTVRLRFAWFVPASSLRSGKGIADPADYDGTHRPWYAGRFESAEAVDAYLEKNYDRLRRESKVFSDCFYDSTLPPEVTEAIAANLTILKSPTTLRQTDGRLWLWEGCNDKDGSCHGSCTHVWNYAQAIAHLFPDLERSLRQTEFNENQDERGHQNFRATLPIRQNENKFHAAADGQLGGVMKAYREWRVSGDTDWLRSAWPKVKKSLDYCISTWDPEEEGWLREPHHNTYDIEFWGPDGMCGTFYAGALKAAVLIGNALADPQPRYESLLAKAKQKLENDLFDGDYFIQKIRWTDLNAKDPVAAASVGVNMNYSPEAIELLKLEGPKYQYGSGCISDGVLGEWMAEVCGVGGVLDPAKVKSHLKAVHTHNFKTDLSEHANPQRPTYAIGHEAGLLLCSWPKGNKPTLPFVYSDEVWTGIEYQVASHLILTGDVQEGLQIVRAVRDRYDGRVRNPFNEYECGHWYGRAMASYGLLQSLTGQRYDAVTQTLHLKPQVRGDFRSFLSTATGFGTVGMKAGKAFLEVKHGTIDVKEIVIDK